MQGSDGTTVIAADAAGPAAKSFATLLPLRVVPLGGYPKRVLDIVLSLNALVIALPIMVPIAILLYLNGGSPIYSHERVGFGGRRFRCYKFRTMVPGADALLAELFAKRPDLEALWKTHHKLPDDPRVTRLGRFLRKTSLDELPQLLNILAGDMSCVGPRPVTEEELKHYGSLIHAYQSVRPGLSGLWQVSGRNDVNYSDRVRLDLAYISKWSLRSDIVILARTPVALLDFKRVH